MHIRCYCWSSENTADQVPVSEPIRRLLFQIFPSGLVYSNFPPCQKNDFYIFD